MVRKADGGPSRSDHPSNWPAGEKPHRLRHLRHLRRAILILHMQEWGLPCSWPLRTSIKLRNVYKKISGQYSSKCLCMLLHMNCKFNAEPRGGFKHGNSLWCKIWFWKKTLHYWWCNEIHLCAGATQRYLVFRGSMRKPDTTSVSWETCPYLSLCLCWKHFPAIGNLPQSAGNMRTLMRGPLCATAVSPPELPQRIQLPLIQKPPWALGVLPLCGEPLSPKHVSWGLSLSSPATVAFSIKRKICVHLLLRRASQPWYGKHCNDIAQSRHERWASNPRHWIPEISQFW